MPPEVLSVSLLKLHIIRCCPYFSPQKIGLTFQIITQKFTYMQRKFVRTSLKNYVNQGLKFFSDLIVVEGPCPGNTFVFSGKDKIFVFIE